MRVLIFLYIPMSSGHSHASLWKGPELVSGSSFISQTPFSILLVFFSVSFVIPRYEGSAPVQEMGQRQILPTSG